MRRKPGISFAILTGLAAVLKQTLARVRYAPTPVNGQQAESEIGAANVGAVTVVRAQRILQTTLIVGPCFGAPA